VISDAVVLLIFLLTLLRVYSEGGSIMHFETSVSNCLSTARDIRELYSMQDYSSS